MAVALLVCLPAAARAHGDAYQLFFEAQGIGGYSTARRSDIYYSMEPDAEMQKPAVGFDYLVRFSGKRGDWGSAALQGRLALVVDDGVERVEPQVYNAWIKAKTALADVWIGHNRPAFGLGSVLDSHGLLLRTLSLQGFGYDRDWGVGAYRDFSWGNAQLSATTGSGMPLCLQGDNYMAAGRVSGGVLGRDNCTVGFSAACGQTLDTMGYRLRAPDPADMRIVGADFTFLRDNIEHRFDFLAGEWLGENTVAAMYRLGVLLDAGGRMMLEAQPTYWDRNGENWLFALCLSVRVTPDLTLRTMYEYDRDEEDNRVLVQLYYYLPI